MNSIIQDLECRFQLNIPKNLHGKKILLAVSGGADSMAMLRMSLSLSAKFNWNINVITVDHKLRPESESYGDCLFVEDFCKKNNIPCFVFRAKNNEVQNLGKTRGMGEEEAARFFRYNGISAYSDEIKADYVFFAHNKNDQEETLIQRFFQGAVGKSALGIPEFRGKFFRPVLIFTREELLLYLNAWGLSYRTDKTNYDVTYLRNRIRNLIKPVLDENIPGWDSSILKGAERKALDEDFFEEICSKNPWTYSDHQAFMDKSAFDNLHISIKIRLVYKALSVIKASDRIPFEIIKRFCLGEKVNSSGVNFYQLNDKVFINNEKKSSKNLYFFAIIEEIKTFFSPVGTIVIKKEKVKEPDLSLLKSDIALPFSIEFEDNKFKFETIGSCGKDYVSVYLKGIENE